METKVTQRRYPDRDWDYKAISTMMNDEGTSKNVIYHTLKQKGVTSKGVEVFQGPNYVLGAHKNDKSYSRIFTLDKLPAKYKKIVDELVKVHEKTKWSTASRVDSN